MSRKSLLAKYTCAARQRAAQGPMQSRRAALGAERRSVSA